METPSSTRRVTRSQTKKMLESERIVNNSRKNGQRVLGDITNDSPIIGLAKTKVLKTPSSELSKKRANKIQGSGESILRGQVKTLLQKVEEKTQLLNAPINISVQSPNLFGNQHTELDSVTPSFFDNKGAISQMGSEMFEEKKDFVTRSLIFDFMEKFDEDESCEEIKEDGELVSELCEGMRKMSIEKVGKHTRFVYDSDGEIVEVEEEEIIVASAAALEFKGLPKPEGKHIRFHDQD